MTRKSYLILEDGSSFEGERFGYDGEVVGEVVFNTSMTGYQEMLTDPSYGGQILVTTYPMIGNYGINDQDIESDEIQVNGLVVRHHCDYPSHPLSEMTLDKYLNSNGVSGISGLDTRALTKKIRSFGVMMGIITTQRSLEKALGTLRSSTKYEQYDFVRRVSTDNVYKWTGNSSAGDSRTFSDMKARIKNKITTKNQTRKLHIVVTDYGLKFNILRSIQVRDCLVTVVPDMSTSEDILSLKPDGVILSPGPGDPAGLDRMVNEVRKIIGLVPIMGICLGHQIVARAMGAKTFKLHFGHRGGNQPVRDLETGNVYVTAQNHGYAVDKELLPEGLEVSHENLNDGTVEGLRHKDLDLMTIQYHSEGSPGPHDSEYLFDRFLSIVKLNLKKV